MIATAPWLPSFLAAIQECNRERRMSGYRRDSLIVETAREIVDERLVLVEQHERYENGGSYGDVA